MVQIRVCVVYIDDEERGCGAVAGWLVVLVTSSGLGSWLPVVSFDAVAAAVGADVVLDVEPVVAGQTGVVWWCGFVVAESVHDAL